MPFHLSFPGNGQQKMLCILVLQELFEGVPKRLPVFVEIQFVLVGHFMSILGRGAVSYTHLVSDTAGPYSVTIDIENEYILNKLKIYEFPPGESDTRSTETTVEVYNAASDAWTTVVDKQPLQPKPKSQTEFPLNNAQGSKLRITFNTVSYTQLDVYKRQGGKCQCP